MVQAWKQRPRFCVTSLIFVAWLAWPFTARTNFPKLCALDLGYWGRWRWIYPSIFEPNSHAESSILKSFSQWMWELNIKKLLLVRQWWYFLLLLVSLLFLLKLVPLKLLGGWIGWIADADFRGRQTSFRTVVPKHRVKNNLNPVVKNRVSWSLDWHHRRQFAQVSFGQSLLGWPGGLGFWHDPHVADARCEASRGERIVPWSQD